jgi:hypothetical protein
MDRRGSVATCLLRYFLDVAINWDVHVETKEVVPNKIHFLTHKHLLKFNASGWDDLGVARYRN